MLIFKNEHPLLICIKPYEQDPLYDMRYYILKIIYNIPLSENL